MRIRKDALLGALALPLVVAALIPRQLSAQVFAAGESAIGSRTTIDPLFQFAATRTLLPAAVQAAAEGAALNAIGALPIGMSAPEKFAAGFQYGTGGGPQSDGRTAIFSSKPNTVYGGTPLFLESPGATAASSFYGLAPGSLLGLRRNTTLAAHAAFHTISLHQDKAATAADFSAPEKAARSRARTRSLGARISVPIVEPIGPQLASWLGLTLSFGLTYMAQSSMVRGEQDSARYLDLIAANNAAGIEDKTQQVAALASSFRVIEHQTTVSGDSTNWVLPLELRTGVRLLILEISLGGGAALNYGRHTVDVSTEAVICGGYLGICSNRYVNNLLVDNASRSGSPLGALEQQVLVGNPSDYSPLLTLHSRKQTTSRAAIPFAVLELRFLFYNLHLIGTARSSGRFTAASLALEWRM